MTRCLSCNGILTSREKSCYGCGTVADVPKADMGKRIANIVNVLFIGSLVLTVASFISYFSEHTPPFSACLATSVVLLFVKRSADQFTSKEA
jgi:hypothetical protein